MDSEISNLWALVAGVLLLLANVGGIAVVEGLTRRRRALTVSARHLGGAGGAILGSLMPLLLGFDVATLAEAGEVLDANAQLWLAMCSAVFMTTVAMSGTAERSTVAANVLSGLLIGGVLAPLAVSARQADGFLGSIEFGGRNFVDVSAGSVFALSGWIGLVGTTIIGPRRGRSGSDGTFRYIPGKSMPLAMGGALLMFSTIFGVLARPGEQWDGSTLDGALSVLVGGAAGGIAGVVVSQCVVGDVRTTYALHGLLAGMVSTMGDPFGLSPINAAILGVGGAVLAEFGSRALESVGIDDPPGLLTALGLAGLWGSLAVGLTNGGQFLAQLVGSGLIAVLALVSAGTLFAVLRLLRIFRVRPDIEVAGLEL